MNKRASIPFFIGIALAVGVLLGSKLNFSDGGERIFATNSKKDKLNRLIDYIDYEYVDQVNTDSIVDVTVNGILETLDPHSVYIPVDQYQDNADDMRGNFVGIGVSFYPYNDSIAVIRSIPGGPAAEAGILGGDRILYADGEALFGPEMDRDSVANALKGEINSRVKLKVYRKGEDELLTFDLKRKNVPLVSVDASYLLTPELGYIKVNRFAETTAKEFDQALNDLKDQGIESLVVDLRNNPGGYISSAERIVDEFLKDDKLVLITRNKQGDEQLSYSTAKGDFEDGKLYVLINENSASASEIVAGALQDNDKGVILGRRSFGKGLVQREMALGDGSAVRLTIARYYTPTGRSIQRPYGNGTDYYDDYQRRYRNGELRSADSIQLADSLKFTTAGGKVVYGGGGIIPDIFVPKDISVENETLEYVIRNGFMSYFIFEYLEANRADFKGMDFDTFNRNFEPDSGLLDDFVSYSRLEEAQIDISDYTAQLKLALKASIAEQLFDNNAFERILNIMDPMVQKVIELDQVQPEI